MRTVVSTEDIPTSLQRALDERAIPVYVSGGTVVTAHDVVVQVGTIVATVSTGSIYASEFRSDTFQTGTLIADTIAVTVETGTLASETTLSRIFNNQGTLATQATLAQASNTLTNLLNAQGTIAGNAPLVAVMNNQGTLAAEATLAQLGRTLDVLMNTQGTLVPGATATALLNHQGTLATNALQTAQISALETANSLLQNLIVTTGTASGTVLTATLLEAQTGSVAGPAVDVTGRLHHSVQHVITGNATVQTQTSLNGSAWFTESVDSASTLLSLEGVTKYIRAIVSGSGTASSYLMSAQPGGGGGGGANLAQH